jgi:nitrite reductase/ring-hydroxylating ferredoxin subunit
MDRWFNVGKGTDFVEGRGIAVDAGDARVAVFRVHGRLHAMQDPCPHMRASLADGKIEQGRRVICHMHGWTFDLLTGKAAGGRSNCAQIYGVEERGDDVYVFVPATPPVRKADGDDWVPWSDEFLKGGED